MTHKKKEKWGLFLGFMAVSLFGLTLPMTRVAVTQLDPVMVGMGRSLVASLIAALILWLRRSPWPSRKEMSSLIVIGLCISAIFPILTASVMRTLPASHGAIVIGLLPLSTAYCVSLMNHEKASGNFWLASFFGSITVVGYALVKSGGMIHWADVLLLSTVVAGGIGYAQGAILARTMGGLNVMCWALVSVMPILAMGAIPQFIRLHPAQISWNVWGAFIFWHWLANCLEWDCGTKL